MVKRISDSQYQQLQHLISRAERDAKPVMIKVAKNINQNLDSLAGEKGTSLTMMALHLSWKRQ